MRQNEYIFENTSIAELSYSEILKHCRETIDTNRRNLLDVQPEAIEINSGVFYKPASVIKFPQVAVFQVNNSLIVSCPCNTPKNKLCEHQTQILFTILDRPDFRIFYDKKLRNKKIQLISKDYGMENENNLDDYFQIKYINNSVSIEPKIKELIKIDTETLKQNLLPQKSVNIDFINDKHPHKKMIMVIGKQKYYDYLNIELVEGETSQIGKIKNPLTTVNPLNLLWKTENIDVVKFMTAVLKFQNNYSGEKSETDFEALKMIARNPLELEVFYHDSSANEKITANSIVPVELDILKANIKLSVFKKEPFFEITGELLFNDTSYLFQELNIKFNYFLLKRNKLSLITNPDMLRVIKFFKANNQILLIHSSKYEEFRQTVLSNLEHQININYSYIVPATKKQLVEQHFDQTVEKIIYLSDQENFVCITPVMKYGRVEIPVLSKKQIFDTDQNGNIFKVERNNDLEIQFTSVLLQQHPQFKEQLENSEYFYLHKDRLLDEDWFLEAFEEWQNNQISILGFNELKKNKLNPNKAIVSVNVASGIDWFNIGLNVRFGKQKASLKQLHKSIRSKSKFVHLDDGTHGILPIEWIQKFADYFQSSEVEEEILKIPKSNFSEIKRLFEQEVLDREIEDELVNYSKNFLNVKNIPETPVPIELQTTLRDYQKEGLSWLNFLDSFGFGGCLADDMGLGKTIQIIAFILSQRTKREYNTNLVVVPTSLLFNWQAEVEKFAPSIKVLTHYGANRIKNIHSFGDYEIVLTTYGTLLSDIRFLKEYHFNYIFLDESQAIKNPNSERYKVARLLKSRNKVVLTGTPIENNTFDIYGQLSFACPGLLGNKEYFKDIYSTLIDKFQDSRQAFELQKKIKPFILRRTKQQVADELPEKTEMVIYCEMGEAQRKVYTAYEKELRDYISAKNEQEIAKSGMHVLTGLTKLRQICDSPSLLKDEERLADNSAKIDVLMEQIENKSGQHKILVFSQFVSMLDLIKKELEIKNIPFEYLTGQTRNRAAKVNEFQTNKSVRVFLISLKAGGTGLNLTEADYVYLIDPWWNPAAENQAIDRCYRIGQKKNVIAVRLICPDTIEEKIMNLQKTKTQLANDLIKTDGSIFKGLSKTDLIKILE